MKYINSIDRKRLGYILIFFILIVIFIGSMSEIYGLDYKTFYKNNSEIFKSRSIISDVFRSIGFAIVRGLTYVALGAEKLYNEAFSFIDLTANSTVNKFIEDFKLALVGLLAISIFILGIIYINNKDKKPPVVTNFIILIVIVTGSSIFFNMANDLIHTVKDEVNNISIEENKSPTFSVINNNMIDLVKLSTKFDGLEKVNIKAAKEDKTMSKYYGIGIDSYEDFDLIDYNQVLNPDTNIFSYQTEGASKEILSKKLTLLDLQTNTYIVGEIDNGVGWNSADDSDFGNDFYYRYQINHFNTDMNLISLIIIYIVMGYKVIRIGFELIMSRLLALFYSTDIAGGERIRKILGFIRDNYILLFVSLVSIKIYQIFASYNAKMFDGFLQGFFSVIIAFCIIDGPNIVEKLLGIDAGLGSSISRMIAAGGALFTISKLGLAGGKGLASGAKKGADAIKKGAGAESIKSLKEASKASDKAEGILGRINDNSNINGDNGTLDEAKIAGNENFGNENFNVGTGTNKEEHSGLSSNQNIDDKNNSFNSNTFNKSEDGKNIGLNNNTHTNLNNTSNNNTSSLKDILKPKTSKGASSILDDKNKE